MNPIELLKKYDKKQLKLIRCRSLSSIWKILVSFPVGKHKRVYLYLIFAVTRGIMNLSPDKTCPGKKSFMEKI